MPKKPGAYYRPMNLDEALRYLSQPNSAPLAGGTKLLAKEEGLSLAAVVDLQDLGLNQIMLKADNLNVGAMVPLAALDEHLSRELGAAPAASLLRHAISLAGPNTYRNAATLGGICASRLPDSELLSALLAMDAALVFQGQAIETTSLEDYLDADEPAPGLITEILVPWADGRGASERVARTPKDYPIVSVAAWKPDEGPVRLAATGLGARPRRLPAAEAALQAGIDESAVDAAAAAASAANAHPGDFRGDAAYRAEMAGVLVRRVLNEIGFLT